MILVVFGATGTVGRHLVEQALAAGHRVTAFARRPEALELTHPDLTLFAGDVFDPVSVANAVKGADAVLVTIGSSKLTGTLRSTGTAQIVRAMHHHGVRRLVCQTTLGTRDSRSNLNFLWKYVLFGMLLRFVLKDHEAQEEIVEASDLDWVIVRPAAFTDGPATGAGKHGFSSSERSLSLKISRADVAGFMLRQIVDNTYRHCSPGLSY